ncbi:MAG: helix-turn-helix domain-containing protein, partial [Acidimicrobiia bacterium]
MCVRRAMVEADLEGLNVTEFCRQHGVSRWFFYNLRRRFRAVGEEALSPRPRIAKRIANRISATVEEAIVALRKELDDGGWDAGAGSIHSRLEAKLSPGTPLPSEATIWRVLTRRGF